MRTQRPGESALLLLDAVDVLRREGVRYAVIGAMAASVHGAVRASMDADAVVSLPAHRLGEIEHAFRSAGFETELRQGDTDDPIGAVLALSDSHGNRVDLLAGLRGMEPGAYTRMLEIPFHNEQLQVIGREDFIAMKLFAGGPQDIADARHALAAAPESVDVDLLRRLAASYGHAALVALDKLLSE
jgi:hypothetical protein